MSFRIYKEGNALVIINTQTWRSERHALDQSWYEFNPLENVPILYSIYKRSPETNLITNQPYTEFADKDGKTFEDDVALQEYLDQILFDSVASYDLETLDKSGDSVLKVYDDGANNLLKELLIQLKINNKQLSIITGENITELDIKD